jgi:hypothetical protein
MTPIRTLVRRLPLRAPTMIVALGALLALSVGISAATGAIPGTNGKIYACFAKSGGDLRVIDKAKQQKCMTGEQALGWNQQGRKGEPGPAGPQGPEGTPGPKGERGGLTGYEVRHATSGDSSQTVVTVGAACPAGKVALGGGASIDQPLGSVFNIPEVALDRSDIASVKGEGWIARAHEVISTDQTWRLNVSVICADGP